MIRRIRLIRAHTPPLRGASRRPPTRAPPPLQLCPAEVPGPQSLPLCLCTTAAARCHDHCVAVIGMLTAALLAALPQLGTACSTVAVGRLATTDGSTMATHSNDGGGATDGRLVRVPARDHAAGSQRPIYYATEDYPRYVGPSLGPMYMSTWPGGAAGYNDSMPIGHIPEVPHTYAYTLATYGLMNEHQVGFGESTCACLYGAKPLNKGGKAMMSIDTLSQIALERSTTAREAITTMGDIAVKYGFYGEGFEGSGESLVVVDPREVRQQHPLN